MAFGALVFKLSVWCGAEGYVSGLQVAALICNKYHLLHLVGILFPHIGQIFNIGAGSHFHQTDKNFSVDSL